MLEVGRVNEPGNRIWLKMGLNRKPQVQKEVPGFLGFGKGVDSFPLSFPPGLLLSMFLVVSWFDLGNISSGRLGELISFLGCPPVPETLPNTTFPYPKKQRSSLKRAI